MTGSAPAYAHPIGVSLGDMTPPEEIAAKARRLEALGYSHLMIPEDYFYEPALIAVTLALQAASAGVDYIRFAISRVERGLRRAGRPSDAISYSTIALTCVDRDGARARAAARPVLASFLAEFGVNTLTDAYGISEELAALIDEGGEDAVRARMPDEWLEDLALVGSPAEVAQKIGRWLEAGLDSICIFFPDEELEAATIELVAEAVIPEVARTAG